jgi:hypothetical protein
MKDVILTTVKKSVITIIIGGIILLCMASCSAPKQIEKRPMPSRNVAVPYWG